MNIPLLADLARLPGLLAAGTPDELRIACGRRGALANTTIGAKIQKYWLQPRRGNAPPRLYDGVTPRQRALLGVHLATASYRTEKPALDRPELRYEYRIQVEGGLLSAGFATWVRDYLGWGTPQRELGCTKLRVRLLRELHGDVVPWLRHV